MRKRIGIFRLKRETEYERHYECAAWYTRIKVPAGDYEITGEVKPDGSVDYTLISMPGVVTGSCFVSLFCGNRIPGTDPNVDKDVGKPDIYVFQGAGYCQAKNILEPTHDEWQKDYYDSFEVILDPEFAATYINFEYNGEPCQTTAIVEKAIWGDKLIITEKMKKCQTTTPG